MPAKITAAFKVSSALKTIIGKELITDDSIAVFELVKNAFDAGATKVQITFKDLRSDDPSILIQDNGSGMNKDDLFEKWLFVAYSAKKDENPGEYRHKIKPKRMYAGAKGIGRFSCDRLGSKLILYTRRKGNEPYHILNVEWSRFEQDAHQEFVNVPVLYSTLPRLRQGFSHGTILEIRNLRSNDWSREKLLRLRRSLERLVNPNQQSSLDDFAIYLTAKDEEGEDDTISEEEPWKLVNGQVRNFLFENLHLKTTQIDVTITNDGAEIRSELTDRGALIYRLREKNPFETLLHGINIRLFVLNTESKSLFTKSMGVTARDYGSVFLYKNGFRIHPFGDPNEDALGIDRRKLQGYSRFLGTRDLTGRIEISGVNPQFQETTSRDGGLIRNATFFALRDFFVQFALRRLEAFAIGIIKFGNDGDLLEQISLAGGQVKEHIFTLISRLTNSKSVLGVEYDPKLVNILENRSAESVSALLRNFRRMAADSNDAALQREVAKAEKRLRQLATATEEAEADAQKAHDRAEKAEQAAEESAERAKQAEEEKRQAQEQSRQATTQTLFLRSLLSRDLEQVLALHHYVGIAAGAIENIVRDLSRMVAHGAPIEAKVAAVFLERIRLQSSRIQTITRFATKANFLMDAVEIHQDVIGFVREYVLNVLSGTITTPDDEKIHFTFTAPKNARFVTKFKPIDLCMVIDNLVSNSRKHKTTRITFEVVECSAEKLVMNIRDDGAGIPPRNASKIFEMGFTTTSGSGLGLFHVSQVLQGMGGTIMLVEAAQQGAEFSITLPARHK